MKNFMKKLPVLISAIALSVVLLITYIALLARPVSYGMCYNLKQTSTTKTTDDGIATIKTTEKTFKVIFNNSKKLTLIEEDGNKVDENNTKSACSYVSYEGKIYASASLLDEKAYENFETLIKSDSETGDALRDSSFIFKADSFKIFLNDSDKRTEEDFEVEETTIIKGICPGQIALSVGLGLIELGLLTFATFSAILFVKDKRQATK